jgi:uncharacterized protein (DUF4415 family)
MKDDTMQKASLDTLRKRADEGELFHDANAPAGETLGRDFWLQAKIVEPKRPPRSVHLKLDPEVFAFYKSRGKGHLTAMQEVLKAYALAHRRS